jgi:hypothetical protein
MKLDILKPLSDEQVKERYCREAPKSNVTLSVPRGWQVPCRLEISYRWGSFFKHHEVSV